MPAEATGPRSLESDIDGTDHPNFPDGYLAGHCDGIHSGGRRPPQRRSEARIGRVVGRETRCIGSLHEEEHRTSFTGRNGAGQLFQMASSPIGGRVGKSRNAVDDQGDGFHFDPGRRIAVHAKVEPAMASRNLGAYGPSLDSRDGAGGEQLTHDPARIRVSRHTRPAGLRTSVKSRSVLRRGARCRVSQSSAPATSNSRSRPVAGRCAMISSPRSRHRTRNRFARSMNSARARGGNEYATVFGELTDEERIASVRGVSRVVLFRLPEFRIGPAALGAFREVVAVVAELAGAG